jgi:solute carrier family 31 (copper transporter), member 1
MTHFFQIYPKMYWQLLVATVLSQTCSSTDNSCTLSTADVTANIKDLCEQMSGMPGCSLQEKVQVDPFVIYATICTDMPTMRGCAAYRTQCANKDNQQCKQFPPIPIPSSAIATRQIFSICNEMTMDGCDVCRISSATSSYSECDLLGTYSRLCIAMPNMSQCSDWNQMCSQSPLLDYCQVGGSNGPAMKMYFHNDISTYILFYQWVPQNTLQYVLSWFVCLFAAVLYEAIQVFVAFMELKWAPTPTSLDVKGVIFGEQKVAKPVRPLAHIFGMSQGSQGIKVALMRAVLRMISATLGYALMLIAMTFNIGLFFAVITGFGIGTFVFAPMVKLHLYSLGLVDLADSKECH